MRPGRWVEERWGGKEENEEGGVGIEGRRGRTKVVKGRYVALGKNE